MNSRHSLYAIAAMILGIASFASAQSQYFNPEVGNGKWSAVQPAASLSYTGYQYFNPEIGNVPQAQPFSAPASHSHEVASGKLEIATPTKVGAVSLNAGNYLVRHIDTGKQHFVEFSQVVENDFVSEGISPYESHVVGRVNCTREALKVAVARTELLPRTDGTRARLEIRGEKAVHLF
jgi:hypothetical protein